MTEHPDRADALAAATLGKLDAVLKTHGPLAIAVSGGVDSMTLAFVACRLEPATTVFHAISPAVPAIATARVRRHAIEHGWQLRCIDAGEMNDPQYRANPVNRCYFCKNNLYRSLRRHTSRPIAAGTNLDDLHDYRPGLLAASEQQVVHPLVEAGIAKAGVRLLAAFLGLGELQDLPASPCLSSRITTGIAIDEDLLPLIDRAEQALRTSLRMQGPASNLRCRIRSGGIDIELPPGCAEAYRTQVHAIVQAVFADTRFSHYGDNINIKPYRMGSAFITGRL